MFRFLRQFCSGIFFCSTSPHLLIHNLETKMMKGTNHPCSSFQQYRIICVINVMKLTAVGSLFHPVACGVSWPTVHPRGMMMLGWMGNPPPESACMRFASWSAMIRSTEQYYVAPPVPTEHLCFEQHNWHQWHNRMQPHIPTDSLKFAVFLDGFEFCSPIQSMILVKRQTSFD